MVTGDGAQLCLLSEGLKGHGKHVSRMRYRGIIKFPQWLGNIKGGPLDLSVFDNGRPSQAQGGPFYVLPFDVLRPHRILIMSGPVNEKNTIQKDKIELAI